MDQFVAEIRLFPFNFAPTGWAMCNGQLLPISQNTALFSLLGTTYGGDGKSNFALPDLQGSVPMHPGQGPGLSLHNLGEIGGSETVTLLESEIPLHTHSLMAATLNSQSTSPANNSLGRGNPIRVYTNAGTDALMGEKTIATSGSSIPHNNMMPYLTMNFCIALQGIFPQRP
ncbi:phage tail protein [Flavobacterium sp. Root935]|jgi:microcystin-dependent protein|uniref:phage tail protein n=2 Tax=Flavobacterium TaxID=237 RepID=UPI00070ED1EB|nr:MULTISPECIES: tail fiber protein [unclassified Flavobacterium]KRD62875.1 phage tail protein [Flavobacterium sp. Root935]MDQ1168085.1 microcystin-dependent protein [Flavobacterium sp. SORGH_AS_0622]TDX13494.1 microcystin-dependent protein [Flavobacterium sp. S87F.05.LMB.W.Kidney.N]BDU24147.1 tail Collar domain-containing protein [Flavobacterium sp. GSB-24]